MSPAAVTWLAVLGLHGAASQVGGGRETHHILHSYVCGLCLYPGEYSGRVWQVIRAGTMAPLTPRPQEFRLQWQ